MHDYYFIWLIGRKILSHNNINGYNRNADICISRATFCGLRRNSCRVVGVGAHFGNLLYCRIFHIEPEYFIGHHAGTLSTIWPDPYHMGTRTCHININRSLYTHVSNHNNHDSIVGNIWQVYS